MDSAHARHGSFRAESYGTPGSVVHSQASSMDMALRASPRDAGQFTGRPAEMLHLTQDIHKRMRLIMDSTTDLSTRFESLERGFASQVRSSQPPPQPQLQNQLQPMETHLHNMAVQMHDFTTQIDTLTVVCNRKFESLPAPPPP